MTGKPHSQNVGLLLNIRKIESSIGLGKKGVIRLYCVTVVAIRGRLCLDPQVREGTNSTVFILKPTIDAMTELSKNNLDTHRKASPSYILFELRLL